MFYSQDSSSSKSQSSPPDSSRDGHLLGMLVLGLVGAGIYKAQDKITYFLKENFVEFVMAGFALFGVGAFIWLRRTVKSNEKVIAEYRKLRHVQKRPQGFDQRPEGNRQ